MLLIQAYIHKLNAYDVSFSKLFLLYIMKKWHYVWRMKAPKLFDIDSESLIAVVDNFLY